MVLKQKKTREQHDRNGTIAKGYTNTLRGSRTPLQAYCDDDWEL